MKLVSLNLICGFAADYLRTEPTYRLIPAPGILIDLLDPPFQDELQSKRKFEQCDPVANSGFEISEITLNEKQVAECIIQSTSITTRDERSKNWLAKTFPVIANTDKNLNNDHCCHRKAA